MADGAQPLDAALRPLDAARLVQGDVPRALVASSSGALALTRWVPGQHGQVVHIDRADAFGDRLAELGLTPGAPVAVLRKAPFGGPMLLRVRQFVLSLRMDEAAAVLVAPAG